MELVDQLLAILADPSLGFASPQRMAAGYGEDEGQGRLEFGKISRLHRVDRARDGSADTGR